MSRTDEFRFYAEELLRRGDYIEAQHWMDMSVAQGEIEGKPLYPVERPRIISHKRRETREGTFGWRRRRG